MASIPFSFQKYPGMERQDLTQAQLGSFKFTPVDNIDNTPSNTNNWLNQMQPLPYAHYPPRLARSPRGSLPNSHSGQNALRQYPSVPSPLSGSSSRNNLDRSQSGEVIRHAPSPSVMYDQPGFELDRALAMIKKMEATQTKRQEQVDSLCASVKMLGQMLEQSRNHLPTKGGSGSTTKQNSEHTGPRSASPNEVIHDDSKDLLDFAEDEVLASKSTDMEQSDQSTQKASNKGPGFEASADDPCQARRTSLWASRHAEPDHYNHFRHYLVDKPALTLPPSLLAKYQPPKSEANEIKQDEGDKEVAVAEVPPPVAASVDPPIKQQDDGKQTEPEPPSISRSPNIPRAIDSLGPLKMNIRWKVTGENPIYDEGEKEKYLWRERTIANQKALFWQYPVRFIEDAEKNVFRTVMIDYIPIGATYPDILAKVRGGAIEKIQLIGPIGSAIDYMTARIVFHSEESASKMASHARDHGMKILDKPVRVWQVITQTYPKTAELAWDVFENMYTRLLLVNIKNANVGVEVRAKMRELLPAKLDWLQDELVGMGKTADGYDLIEFTSVQAATMAMEQLRRDKDFGGIELDFEDDPCAEQYPFGG
ncbi:hypothetical protein DV735_g797, partial [Chaetothyriales sp. CBS 134920]